MNPDYEEAETFANVVETLVEEVEHGPPKKPKCYNLQSSRKGKEFTRLREGYVVCILEDKVPQGQWKLEKIDTLLTERDIQVRGATVRIVTLTGKLLCINRPVNKLCPLEVPDRLDQHTVKTDQESNVVQRKRRAAPLDTDFL